MKAAFKKVLFSFVVFICGFAGSPHTEEMINNKASLPDSFHFEKLGLKIMASFINKKKGTMATLFANAKALAEAKTGGEKLHGGEVFALITWNQQPDTKWFGANIPGDLQSVEILTIPDENDQGGEMKYCRYKGERVIADRDTTDQQYRIAYLLSQKPSVLP